MVNTDYILQKNLVPLKDAARRYLDGEQSGKGKRGDAWQGVVEQGWLELIASDAENPASTLLMLNAELGRKALALPLAECYWVLQAAQQHGVDSPLAQLAEHIGQGQAVALALPGAGDTRQPESMRFTNDKLDAQLFNLEHLPLATSLVVVDTANQTVTWTDSSAAELQKAPGFALPALHHAQLSQVPAQQVSGLPWATSAANLLRLSLAARAWGASERGVELIVEYAGLREQFGQPIGKFQAVQHKLANMRIALEASRLLIARAGAALDDSDPQWELHAASAFAYAGSALRTLLLDCHHVFGAIGYMEEHDLPDLFRRVHADLSRLGGMRIPSAGLGQTLLDSEESAARMLRPLSLNAEADTFREHLNNWLSKHWTSEQREAHWLGTKSDLGFDRTFLEAVGSEGWIGMALPRAYGGQERDVWEQYVFDEVMNLAEAPTYSYGASRLLAPAIMQFGSPAQREQFLPMMLGGKAVFCLGYSEPNSGSDLASLKTRAVRDGDHWVINGSKIWTTLGTVGDYVWLAARTDPDAPKHKGISVFILPLDTPGISIRPVEAMNGQLPCAVFYDDVRVPADALVGEVNQGWAVITSALAHERIMMGGQAARLVPYLRKLVRAIRADASLAADPVVHERIGLLYAELEAARLLALQPVAIMADKRHPISEAAIAKTFSSELYERLSEAALDILGADALLSRDAPGNLDGGLIGHHLIMSLMFVIGGGANEIQRNIIAQAGLGLPR